MRQGLLLFTILLGFHCFSQNQHPEDGHLFLQDELARVDILLPMDSLILMYDSVDYAAEHEFEATFIYTTSTTVDTIHPVGFRFRGNTSLLAAKKSFKVSFNTFDSGGQFHGLEKMNLNGEHNDVSLSRSKISWELLADLELVSSRTSYVALYVNGIYAGVYINVEHIDEEFVKKRYGQKVGNLYKCLWPATLEYWGNDPDNYKAMNGDRRIYDLKTNKYRDDYSRLANFINVLNNTSDSEFICEIEQVFNVDDYLKIAALDILIGNWDGYIFNKNNYYLYENPRSGRIDYIPYDLDNTWGIDWFGVDWTQQEIYDWNAEARPLYDRLMGIPKYKEQFTYYLDMMMDSYFSSDIIEQRLTEIQAMISDAVAVDDFYTYDYGFTYEDFLESGTEAWGEHVDHGILDYIDQRVSTAQFQMDSFEPPHAIKELQDSLIDLDTHLIRAWMEGEADGVSMIVGEDDDFNTIPMYDDGLHLDGQAGDGLYALTLSSVDYLDYAEYQVESQQGTEYIYEPCDFNRAWFSMAEGPLYINELMPSNDQVISDEEGEFDDWIELFNTGPSSVYLGEFYLTDDIHCPLKWQLPAFNMTPNTFQLIWADKDEEQGLFHSTFKLSSQGEELAIFKIQNGAPRLVDYIDFPSMASDHSWGRLNDAEEPWVIFSSSTPNASNNAGILNLIEEQESTLRVFPNPSKGQIRVSGIDLIRGRLFDQSGRILYDLTGLSTSDIDLRGLPAGVYQLIIEDDRGDIYNERLVIIH